MGTPMSNVRESTYVVSHYPTHQAAGLCIIHLPDVVSVSVSAAWSMVSAFGCFALYSGPGFIKRHTSLQPHNLALITVVLAVRYSSLTAQNFISVS